ncbi:MAG: hypothetical protein ABWY78_21330 [Microvirga sp.]
MSSPPKPETPTRAVSLEGDSPEVVAFALLRYLAQLEQARATQTGVVFDREWILNAYADCLEAVKGQRRAAATDKAPASAKAPAAGKSPAPRK